jgi:hypothetical protein
MRYRNSERLAPFPASASSLHPLSKVTPKSKTAKTIRVIIAPTYAVYILAEIIGNFRPASKAGLLA